MAELRRPDGARIAYEVHGDGFPVLALAPGGVSSRVEAWEENFFHPVRELADRFTVITVDHRYAGRSHAPATPFSYEQTAADHIALLDHLGVEQAHVLAAGSACAQAWRLAADAPGRVRSLVAQEPAGRDHTNILGTFLGTFDEAMRLPRAEGLDGVIALAEQDGVFDRNPGAGPFAQRLHDDPAFRQDILALRRERYIALLVRFRDGFWPDGSAYFSVPEDWMATCPAPVLVLAGNTARQPESLAKRIGREAPSAVVLNELTETGDRPAVIAAITGFLTDHSPSRKEL